ncbi:ATP-binding protein [Ornithinimicrobium ciconiae]|uniref:ATP-binding protein n=1 Tax=Ornithinimicrobium ciconiae TaxID=2594265 RepID=A0A516GAD8_9MICO|nr:ATP-binding protein [Ornithinimicrobium ciconiae]QDO88458.1 ATP-binding protein [Ornithinimicrobium ciconiae]
MHLLYGLAGSGKTTLSRELSRDGRGVRFTLDEWMLRLHPGLDFESTKYGDKASDVRELMWTIAGCLCAANGCLQSAHRPVGGKIAVGLSRIPVTAVHLCRMGHTLFMPTPA